MHDKLIESLISDGSITFGDYIGKSGTRYECETDIRNSFYSFGRTKYICNEIYDIIDKLEMRFDFFLGVPETGTVIAHFLNDIKYEKSKIDFGYNYLRSVPKERQKDCASTHTILPHRSKPSIILIEDDVVTGATLLSYLKVVVGLEFNVIAVLSIFGRECCDKLIRDTVESEYNVKYVSLIKTDDVRKRFVHEEK